MQIITASNKQFEPIYNNLKSSLEKLKLKHEVYDLGDLGFGIPFFEDNNLFQKAGYYNIIANHYKSRSLFKPRVVKDALERFNDDVVWLDSDTQVLKKFDISGDYDIGVAEREFSQSETLPNVFKMMQGKHNAGVIFFKNTKATREFVDKWCELVVVGVETERGVIRNDQLALNNLLKFFNVKIKVFPHQYNDMQKDADTIIFHQKVNPNDTEKVENIRINLNRKIEEEKRQIIKCNIENEKLGIIQGKIKEFESRLEAINNKE